MQKNRCVAASPQFRVQQAPASGNHMFPVTKKGAPTVRDRNGAKWVCLKMLCKPLNPMVLLIIIPIKWL